MTKAENHELQSWMSREEECFKEKGVANCLKGGDGQVTGSLRINTGSSSMEAPGEADRRSLPSGANRDKSLTDVGGEKMERHEIGRG